MWYTEVHLQGVGSAQGTLTVPTAAARGPRQVLIVFPNGG
jgi:hypothetical protein